MRDAEQAPVPEQPSVIHANVINQTPDITRLDVHAGQAPSRTHEMIQTERVRLLQAAKESGALSLRNTDAQRIQIQATANVHRVLIQG